MNDTPRAYNRAFSQHLRDLMAERGITVDQVIEAHAALPYERLTSRDHVRAQLEGLESPTTDLIEAVSRLTGVLPREMAQKAGRVMREANPDA